MSEWIASRAGNLSDLPLGMWEIVSDGRMGFELEGEALTDFVRRCIYVLLEAGARPVQGTNTPNVFDLQTQYGRTNTEIADAVIREWLAQGAPTPAPWTGLWFGLPWSYERHVRR